MNEARTPPVARVAEVLLPLALDKPYSYAVPDGLHLAPGDIVAVPLGPRTSVGVVWSLDGQAGDRALKAIGGKLDVPPMADPLRKLVDWLAWYTLAPRGSALGLALRLPGEGGEVARIGVRLAGPPPKRMTPGRQRVLEAAAGGLVHLKRDLAKTAGVGTGVVDGLVDEGTLQTIALAPDPVAGRPDPDYQRPDLSALQNGAAQVLASAVVKAAGLHPADQAAAPVTLLDGVTGSGKTEVYFEAVAECIRQGRQTLILMPEIALTSVFLDRFAARFGVRPAAWHSGVGNRRRERLYAAVSAGEVAVVAGARSALFLPFRDLGLVVVDEEHEGAYKQEDGVCYHTRDMAVVRGRLEGAAVILASATPAIETRVNAQRGRFDRVALPERFGARRLPNITAIDLRREQPAKGRWLSPRLVEAIGETVSRGEQALVFLNRRGYAPLTLCRSCGHRFTCRCCSAWLVEHRFRRALVCHHCGHSERLPEGCPACGSVESFAACGPGVERIAEEIAEVLPDARRIVLSSDFPGGAERLRAELAAVADGQADIVIGTQLVAKGHNFPQLTLVGVVDADIGLTSGDPRAAERTFQLLQQVTGRAGRGAKPGRALVQTYQPDHPVIAALLSGGSERFYREETAAREAAGLPPFGRLASLIVSASKRDEAEAHGRALAIAAQPPPGFIVLGPAEAPLAQIRGRFRFRLLVKANREAHLQTYLREWIARAPKARGSVRVQIDVDPQSFL